MTASDLPTPDDLARLREAAEQYGFDSLRLLLRAYDAVVAERDAARADLATLRRLALDAVNAVGLCPCHDPDGDCAKIRALSDALPPEAGDG